MTPLKKVAVFLMIIGAEKGQGIIGLMDNSEIKAVVPEIRGLTAVSRETQAGIAAEFKALGYEDNMGPAEALTVIRFLFDGRKIGGKQGR